MTLLNRILGRHPDLRPHEHKWKPLKRGYPIYVCKCGTIKPMNLQVGERTVQFGPFGSGGQAVIRYSGTTVDPLAVGAIGMKLENGRPQAFVDGISHQLAIGGEVPSSKTWEVQNLPNSTTLVGKGISTLPTENGTKSLFDTNRGEFVRYASSGAANSDHGWIAPSFDQVERQFYPKFDAAFRLSSITNIRVWIGLFSGNPMASATPVLHFAGFRFDSAIDAGFFQAVTGDAVSTTVVATTLSALVGNEYFSRIFIDEATGTVYLMMGNLFTGGLSFQPLATISTTVPAATQRLGYVVQARTTAAVVQNFEIGKMAMAQFPPMT